ncbi:uncharacterized protein LY79DRAFT_572278 [Colletotrichum navitas]|uniref:Uncharacterized protein n=1 Tax=Colletotrichum navitas TaxID=681940 RepID=A0AAD8PKW1_9PEZI|nr:uncharacterized protein LY79DRAFT_572278 [Colletotrichum navitas]KAK1566319.1 hypothetical protein LY79DRAFT_572278 [Colletotrichum navitas]
MAQRKRKVASYSPDTTDGCIGDSKCFFLQVPSRVKQWSKAECRSYYRYYKCCFAFASAIG